MNPLEELLRDALARMQKTPMTAAVLDLVPEAVANLRYNDDLGILASKREGEILEVRLSQRGARRPKVKVQTDGVLAILYGK